MGRPGASGTLLVNWSPFCGYCSKIVPELTQCRQGLSERGIDLVLPTVGTEEDNRKEPCREGRSPRQVACAGRAPSLFHGRTFTEFPVGHHVVTVEVARTRPGTCMQTRAPGAATFAQQAAADLSRAVRHEPLEPRAVGLFGTRGKRRTDLVREA